MNRLVLAAAASLALASFSAPAFAERVTSLGSSRNQTPGGSNILKYSVMRNNSMPGARELTAAIDGRSLPYYLANGYRVSVPAMLANDAQVPAWKAGERRLLTEKGSLAIAANLTRLIQRAQHLHSKAQITNGELATVNGLQTFVSNFTSTAALLAKHKVAVALDE